MPTSSHPLPVHVIDRAVSRGQLVRVLPQVYCDPGLLDAPLARLQAALEYAGKNAALSHTSGLPLWNPPVPGRLTGAPDNRNASVAAGR